MIIITWFINLLHAIKPALLFFRCFIISGVRTLGGTILENSVTMKRVRNKSALINYLLNNTSHSDFHPSMMCPLLEIFSLEGM